jgi:endonuclease/exonuclease/phosphatase family metal-dependent hydrolase
MMSSALRALLYILVFTATPVVAGERITVMTRNLYLGADLSPVLAARTVPELLVEVGKTWAVVQASDPEARIAAIAQEIADAHADLVGVQEAALWRTGAFQTEATTVEFDFITLLLDALKKRGMSYEVAADVVNFDVQLPGVTQTGVQEIRLTDRDAILVRTGQRDRIRWSQAGVNKANFQTNVSVPVTLQNPPDPPVELSIPLLRGWISLDFSVAGTRARFLTAHLETLSPLVQMAQASELLAGPADTDLPLIFVCDCNSSADGIGTDATPTYGALLAAGFEDAWTSAHHRVAGFTCCQLADLRNNRSELTERIDFVFLRGAVDVRHARRTGTGPTEGTDGTDLWPSDHAGVAATLEFPHRHAAEKAYYPGPR